MPIPLGVLAVAGAGGAAAGAFELIQTTVLTSEASSVTLSNLSGLDYKHLQLRVVARTSRSDTVDELHMRFNGISTTTYNWHGLTTTGSTINSQNFLNQNKINLATVPAAQNSAEVFGATIIDILDYKTGNKNVVSRSMGGMAITGANYLAFSSGFRATTTSLSSVTFLPLTGPNFGSGSRFSVYGIKG